MPAQSVEQNLSKPHKPLPAAPVLPIHLAPVDLHGAMGDLRLAALREDAHSVCAAYLAMRSTGPHLPHDDLLQLAKEAVGETALVRWRLAALSRQAGRNHLAEFPPRWRLAAPVLGDLLEPLHARSARPRARRVPRLAAMGVCPQGAATTPRVPLAGPRGCRPTGAGSDAANHATLPAVGGLLVHAFSHWACHTCKDGTAPCEECAGAGRVPWFAALSAATTPNGLDANPVVAAPKGQAPTRRTTPPAATCPDCHGAGFLPCPFCAGTRWADEQLIPRELRPQVIARRQARTVRDAEALLKIVKHFARRGLRRIDHDHRHKLLRRTFRLRARLTALLTPPDSRGLAEFMDLGDLIASPLPPLAAKIDRCWRTLLSRGPHAI